MTINNKSGQLVRLAFGTQNVIMTEPHWLTTWQGQHIINLIRLNTWKTSDIQPAHPKIIWLRYESWTAMTPTRAEYYT